MDSLPERCGKIMNDNVALLQYISQNTEMGKSSIQQLIEVVKHEEFRRVIESQYREYDEMYDLAHKALEKRHKEAKKRRAHGENLFLYHDQCQRHSRRFGLLYGRDDDEGQQ